MAIIVDSVCDLSEEICEKYNVFLMPIGFQIEEKHFRDRRIPEMASDFHSRFRPQKTSITTKAASTDTIRNLLIGEIVDEYENALLLCISSTRSQIYQNALQAAAMIPSLLEPISSESPRKLKAIEVIDTLSVFSGQALAAYIAAQKLEVEPKLDFSTLASELRNISKNVTTYVIPNDLAYLKNRGKQRNERSIGVLSYAIGQKFNLRPLIKWFGGKSQRVGFQKGYKNTTLKLYSIVKEGIEKGLAYEVITISYAGDIEIFKKDICFLEFEAFAKTQHISILLAVMSITATVYLGPGALSLSFSSKPYLSVDTSSHVSYSNK